MKKKNLILGLLGACSAAASALYMIDRAAFSINTAKNKLKWDHKDFHSWKLGNIYYSKSGEGSPLLLIHDLHKAGSAYEWDKVRSKFSQNHTVYTIDLPGCGRSDKDSMLYTNYFYVAAVNDFVKKVIGEKTDIVTSGRSSSIAIMASFEEPELYGKMILVNPESFDSMTRKRTLSDKILGNLMAFPLIGTTYYIAESMKCMIMKKLKNEGFENPDKVTDDMADTFCEAAHLGGSASRFSRVSDMKHFTQVNIVNALKNLENDIYIVSGQSLSDSKYIQEGYLYFARHAKGSMVKGKGLPHMEYPDKTADIIGAYLDE